MLSTVTMVGGDGEGKEAEKRRREGGKEGGGRKEDYDDVFSNVMPIP